MLKINKTKTIDIFLLALGFSGLFFSLFYQYGIIYIFKKIIFFPEIRVFYTSLMPFAYPIALFFFSLYLILKYLNKKNILNIKYLGFKCLLLFLMIYFVPAYFYDENKIILATKNIIKKQINYCNLENSLFIKNNDQTIKASDKEKEIFVKEINNDFNLKGLRINYIFSTMYGNAEYNNFIVVFYISKYPNCIF